MIDLDLQIACAEENLPTQQQFTDWLTAALKDIKPNAEVTIRLVEEDESQALNSEYRGKDKPTNVLSFEFDAPPMLELNLLGDLVICKNIIERETIIGHIWLFMVHCTYWAWIILSQIKQLKWNRWKKRFWPH